MRENARSYWNRGAVEFADDNMAVEFSARSQVERFRAFLDYQESVGCSILDVGCGTGALFEFIRVLDSPVDYLGIDISDEMIARCQSKLPDVRFEVHDVQTWSTDETFDYVVCFGAFNVNVDNAVSNLPAILERMFELSQKAVHVSFVSGRYLGVLDPHIRSWDPVALLEAALLITPYVRLQHDYLPNDVSLTLYHEPRIDRRRTAGRP
jgi:SAM-dependent methyltransferase